MQNTWDMGSIPGSGTSPGGGNSNPLQCCCLENPMDRGTWLATVHRITESDMTDWAHMSSCVYLCANQIHLYLSILTGSSITFSDLHCVCMCVCVCVCVWVCVQKDRESKRSREIFHLEHMSVDGEISTSYFTFPLFSLNYSMFSALLL